MTVRVRREDILDLILKLGFRLTEVDPDATFPDFVDLPEVEPEKAALDV